MALKGQPKALSEESYRFRSAVLDALDTPSERFFYVDSDTSVGVCPICDGALGVAFHGHAPRVDLTCQGGCTEAEVAQALRRKVKR